MLRQVVRRSSDQLRHRYKLTIDIFADEFDVARLYEAELYELLLQFHKMKQKKSDCSWELVEKKDTFSL